MSKSISAKVMSAPYFAARYPYFSISSISTPLGSRIKTL